MIKTTGVKRRAGNNGHFSSRSRMNPSINCFLVQMSITQTRIEKEIRIASGPEPRMKGGRKREGASPLLTIRDDKITN